MVFTFWFFLMKREKVVLVKNDAEIIVEGGYTPNSIQIPKGKTTKISFIRRDPSACLEEVVLSDFKIRKFLPINQKITIALSPEKSGEYSFSCGMNMFKGKIIVT